MTPLNRDARIAGLVYLVLALVAPFRLIYLPGKLFVQGDAVATAANIAAHEWLFRVGIAGDLFTGVINLVLGLALYRVFCHTDKRLAALMVIFGGLMVTPLYFFNVLNDSAALILVRGADFLNVFDAPQRAALAMLFLKMHGQAILADEIFWGLWLFPLATLVWRCRFIPRFISVWLYINAVAYLVLSVTGLLWPQFADTVDMVAFPAQLGEIAFVLWMVIMGARPRLGAAVASASD